VVETRQKECLRGAYGAGPWLLMTKRLPLTGPRISRASYKEWKAASLLPNTKIEQTGPNVYLQQCWIGSNAHDEKGAFLIYHHEPRIEASRSPGANLAVGAVSFAIEKRLRIRENRPTNIKFMVELNLGDSKTHLSSRTLHTSRKDSGLFLLFSSRGVPEVSPCVGGMGLGQYKRKLQTLNSNPLNRRKIERTKTPDVADRLPLI